MSLRSIGGLILDKTVSNPSFEGMAVFTPVINGEGHTENGAFIIPLLKTLWPNVTQLNNQMTFFMSEPLILL